jgi:hypothetical protein
VGDTFLSFRCFFVERQCSDILSLPLSTCIDEDWFVTMKECFEVGVSNFNDVS